MPRAKRHFYYGWWIVAACLIGLIVVGGSGFYSFSVFFPHLVEEFHWSRASSAAAVSAYWIASGAAGPFIGRLIDRRGPKSVMTGGILMTGFSLVMLSFTRSLFYLYCFYGLLAISHAAAALVPYGFLISQWFSKQRGRAMAIASIGISLGGFLLVPLTEFLVRSYGWRMSYIILGVLMVCIFMPIVLFVVKANPKEAGRLTNNLPAVEMATSVLLSKANQQARLSPDFAWTLRNVSRTWPFWLMSATLFCYYMVLFGVLTHQIPFILDMGITSATAAVALSFTAFMGVIGKLVIGFVSDRFSVKVATVLIMGLQLAGVLILMTTDTLAMLWIYVLVFGFTIAGAALRPLLPTWLFGLSALGFLQGVAQMAGAVGSAIGPYLAGYIYDVSRSYHWAFIIFAIICGIGLAAISFAHPVRRPQPQETSAN